MAETGLSWANRALAVLFLRLGRHPDSRQQAVLPEKPEHVLTEAELVDLWLACDDAFGGIIKLLMSRDRVARKSDAPTSPKS